MSLREIGIGYKKLPAQKKFHDSRSKFKAYIGGYGSGKTYAGCHEAIRLSVINRGLTGMMLAPTYRMLNDATLPALREILDRADIKYNYRASDERMLMPWGSKIIFRSAENPDRLRGPNLAWVGIDEGALITKAAWDVAISRVRHPDAKRRCAFITTTPEGFNWLYDEFVDKRRRGYRAVYAPTTENFYLPEEYAQDLAAAYDPVMARQYLMGEFVNPAAGRVYRFDRNKHVRDDIAYDPALPLKLAIDFNVDPLHAAAVQVKDGDVHVVDEIVIPASGTYDLCREARARYGDVSIIAYPDPTGRARKTAGTPEAPSDFAILMAHGFEVRARTSSPFVKDRINAVNRRLIDGSGRPGLYVSGKCRETIRSFEQTCFKPGSSAIDKSAGAEHMSDAIGYFIEYEYPIRPPSRVEYTGIRKSFTKGF
ncbi:MAG: phage terminase large subunit [Nitrospirota bacterium]